MIELLTIILAGALLPLAILAWRSQRRLGALQAELAALALKSRRSYARAA